MAEGGRKIGGYALGEKIRTGPHLAVFESRDNLGRLVEVACYRGAKLRDRTGKDSFLEEARRTAALHHENLCLIVDAGTQDDVWYAVSVSPDAPSLRDLLDRGGALDGERVAVVAAGALSGLGYLAREDLRHGDLRPETIFLSGGRLLLAPRPLVPYAPRERDRRYLSPEEVRAQGSDIRSDLYSLGLVLLEALTGGVALREDSARETFRPAAPADTPPGLATLVLALLAESPSDRPPDPRTAARLLSGEVVPAAAPATDGTPGAPAAGTAAATAPAPSSAPAPSPRPPGVLTAAAGGKSAVYELGGEPVGIASTPDGSVRIRSAADGDAPIRIERGSEGDVLVVAPDADPRPRVNGSLVDRHVLTPGDRITIGEGEIEYSGPRPAPRKHAPVPRGRRGSPVLVLASIALCLAVLGFGIVKGIRTLGEGEDVIDAAAEAENRLSTHGRGPDAAPGTGAGDREQARRLFEAAQDYAAKNPDDVSGIVKRYREISSFYGGTDFGWFAQQKLLEIGAREGEALARKWEELGREVGRRIEEDRLYDAHLLYLNFGEDHPDTLFSDRAKREAATLLEAIRSRYADDLQRVEAALDSRDYGVALDLLLAIERYGTPEEKRVARARKEEVKSRIQETQVPGEPPPAEAPDEPPVEPPVEPPEEPPVEPTPGGPGPEDPAKSDAAALLESARKLFERGRWEQVIEVLHELAALGDTRTSSENRAEIERMLGLSRIEIESYGVLFRGTPKVLRGRRVELSYSFATEEETEDWVYLNPFADVRPGSFWFTEEGIRGRGVGAVLHPAVFEPGTLTMTAKVKPLDEVEDFGFQMLEPEGLVRFYLFSVQNRYFTIGAERALVHENVIWIFGEGAWADTPNAELGYVRVAGSKDPSPSRGEWMDLSAGKEGGKVWMTINGKRITGSALGDDRYEYPALQPALYLLGAEAVFDEIVIRGTLDAKWAEDRMARFRSSLTK